MKDQKKAKPEKGISAGYVSDEENTEALLHEHEMKAKALESHELGEKIEEEKKEEGPKEEETAKESKSADPAGRTPEEKQKQYEEAYGMSEKKQAEAELQRKTPLVIRESLINFVIEQEMLLRIHDELKGIDGWLDGHPLILLAKLMEETGELAESLLTSASAAKIRREAADVCNLAMMIAHKSGKL